MSVKRKNGLRQEYVTVVLGTQWGDEGKGRVVDMLSPSADIICRCQGGGNADHAVVIKGVRYQFHLLPSGIMNPKCKCIIGNGVVIHLPGFFEEIEKKEAEGLNNWQDRLIVSDRAHLVFDFHKQVDHLQELEKGNKSLGTTKQGIGPAYISKISRTGIRVGELIEDYDNFSEKFIKLVALHKKAFSNLEVDVNRELELYKVYADRVRPLVKDTVHYLHEALKDRKKILIEGANAALLDIDFGTYPYVTSSNASIGGVYTGLGLSPNLIGEIIGVVKAYTSRVGAGPFPTELYDINGEMLQKIGVEIGGTTKRKRRCGWLDLVLLKYTTMLNGCTSICLTKLDVLDVFPSFKVCVAYRLNNKLTTHFPSSTSVLAKVEPVYKEFIGWQTSTKNIRIFKELPLSAQKYVHLIEKYLDIPVKWVSVDADRESIISRNNKYVC